jgi:peptidoglycan/LPS O-acetylase OafA/YrhL
MMSSTPAEQVRADTAIPESAFGRIVVIDVLRGLAILWVMVFHLWTDMHGGPQNSRDLYKHLGQKITEGHLLEALTAFTDLVMGLGAFGVPIFMMLSGLSLVLNAERRRGQQSILHGYITRIRRVVVAYWAGLAIVTATVAGIAALQALVDGHSFQYQWHHVTIAVLGVVNFDPDELLWAYSIFGPLFRERLGTDPVGALWFIPLLLQYYLVYPPLLLLLRRVGPFGFAIAGMALVIFARTILTELAPSDWNVLRVARTMNEVGLFRGSEFLLGMSLGYWLAYQRRRVTEWVATFFDSAMLYAIGMVLLWASIYIIFDPKVLISAQIVASHVALAMLTLPLIFKEPGRLESSAIAKALVFLGMISLAALIINDCMRYVASFLRVQDAPDILWWPFLVVVYIPLGSLLAYPLAKVLGLLPAQRRPETHDEATTPAPPPSALPAGGLSFDTRQGAR